MNAQNDHPFANLLSPPDLAGNVKRLFDYHFECVSVSTPVAERQALINKNYATFQAQVDVGLSNWNHVHPYDIADWGGVLTEVEFGAWQDIRSSGRMPIWPRLPVQDMVISFGNPAAKIALLCSTESETIDQKTADHVARLRDLGWFVVAVTARRCLFVMEAPEDVQERMGEIPEGYADRYRSETLRGAIAELRAHREGSL